MLYLSILCGYEVTHISIQYTYIHVYSSNLTGCDLKGKGGGFLKKAGKKGARKER